MFDPRQKELARKLVNYSCKIKKGEHCLVEMFGVDTVFVSMLVEEIYNAGGVPHARGCVQAGGAAAQAERARRSCASGARWRNGVGAGGADGVVQRAE